MIDPDVATLRHYLGTRSPEDRPAVAALAAEEARAAPVSPSQPGPQQAKDVPS